MSVQTFIESLNKIPSVSFQTASCQSALQNLQNDLKQISWDDIKTEDLKAQAPQLLSLIWATRLELHKNLAVMDPVCALSTRVLFQKFRDIEDLLTEILYAPESLDPYKLKFQDQPVPILDRAAYPSYFVRKDLDATPFHFQNGDVVIARGISFFSAIISQVSNNKSHFSHSLVIAIDPSTRLPRTVESYVGKGVQSYEINHALKNENVRLMVLRPKDKSLGERAGEEAFAAAKKNLPYDYEMNFDDDSQMSCVEVPTYSYKRASGGVLRIPQHPAQLELNNDSFLKQMHLRKGSLITPDDLETDPHFELVLDWKDPRLVRDSRQKDAVLSEVTRWLDELQYQFQDTTKSWFVVRVVLPLRQTFLWPLIARIPGVPEIDKHIPASTLNVMTILDQVSERLLKELKKKDEDHKAQYGRVMSNEKLRETLENIRQQDLEKFKKGETSLIHEMFRPQKESNP